MSDRIPSGWTSQKLGEPTFAKITSGGTPSRSNASFYGGSIPWVKSGELEDSDISSTEEQITTEALDASSAKVFPPNTVLLAMYGATVGKTGMLKVRAATNQAVCSIQPFNGSFSPRFLQFQLMHIRPSLLRARYGGAQPNISQTIIKALVMQFPPLPEQRKIAAVLAKIRRAVELQEAILANVRELKKSLMHRLFTHGLRGEASSWKTAAIGETCSILNGYAFSGDDYADEGIINFRVVNIREEGRVNLADDIKYLPISFADTYREYLLKAGDILLVMVGATRGKLCILTSEHLPALMNQNMWRIIPQSSDLDRDFLYYFLCVRIPVFMKQFSEEARGFFKKGDLRNETIPIPSLADQVEIATTLRLADEKIAVHESKKTALQDLFKTTLNQLMTGAVRVPDLVIDTGEVEAA